VVASQFNTDTLLLMIVTMMKILTWHQHHTDS